MKRTGPANSFEERLVSLICSHVEKLENEEIERLNKKIKSLEGEVDEYEMEMDFMDHGDHRRCPWCGHFSKETNPSCNGVATDCIWFVPCKKWCIKERGLVANLCQKCKEKRLCDKCTICESCDKLP